MYNYSDSWLVLLFLDPGSGYFSIQIHHGGRFIDTGDTERYVGGQVTYFDHCEIDYMSLIELDDFTKKLGYMDPVRFCYRNSETGSLVYILTDKEAIDMCTKHLPHNKIATIYMKHKNICGILEGQPSINHEFIEQEAHFIGNPVGAVGQEEDAYFTNVPVGAVEEEEEAYFTTQHVGEVGEEEEDDSDIIDSCYEQSECEDGADDDEQFDKYVDTSFGAPNLNELEAVESDYGESDELLSGDSSSNDDEDTGKHMKKKRLPKFPQFNAQTDMNNPRFIVGMEFGSGALFKEAVREHSIKTSRPIRFMHNTTKRVRAVCKKKNKGCPWVVYATKLEDSSTFRVQTYVNTHKCHTEQKNRFATYKWLSKKYVDQIKIHPNMAVSSFGETVKKDFVLKVSRSQLYRARRMAQITIEGTYAQQYALLWDYCAELRRTNPDSSIFMKTEEDMDGQLCFQRVYICFEACKKGFRDGCRTLIGLDGCHIKGPHPGQLLTAVGIDGNNGLFPIAYAVVEVENKSTWLWFLKFLINDVGIENGWHWTFISDKQKGLLPAVSELLPNSEHRHCVRHLYNNFKGEHKGLALKNRLWAAARATTVAKYKDEMEQMKLEDDKAVEWLADKSPTHWSRAYFNCTPKCDILLNNLCESFNAAIIDARDKPILTMLERIRMYLMVRMAEKRDSVKKWIDGIGPRVSGILEKNKQESGYCIAVWAGDLKFQVSHWKDGNFSVDLQKNFCSCRRWNLTGIPCPHAISAIYKQDYDVIDFVDNCYKSDVYLKAYGPFIHPIFGQDQWVKTGTPPLASPIYHKQPGRPKKVRIREPGEKRAPILNPNNPHKLRRFNIKIKCTICGEEGHNQRSCIRRQHATQFKVNPYTSICAFI